MRQPDGPSGPTVAVAASFTAFPIVRPLQFWLNEVLGLDARVEMADAGQVVQTLLDPRSVFAANQSGLNVILLRWEDWDRGAPHGLEETVRLLVSSLATSATSSRVPHLVCICPPPLWALAVPEVTMRRGKLDDGVASEVERLGGVEIITSAELARLYPVVDYGDPGSDELAQIPYRSSLFVTLAAVIARRLHAVSAPPYKAIVVDCDGTLWGGICAEDGPAGVVIDEPRRALQEFLVHQRGAGLLLGLSSKNDVDDVAAVFAQRDEMPLRWHHFAARRINWSAKADNIRDMAAELGIGTESVVFLDDDPIECAEVRRALPEVLTLELPSDAARLPAFVRGAWAFDRRKTTGEDRLRAAHYLHERERAELQRAATGLADFRAALQLEVRMRPLEAGDLRRAAQLAQRVTQFTLSAIRRSEAELEALWRSGALEGLVVDVSDRFGDYGLVGLLLWTRNADCLTVDSMLLSCRALGRGVEHQMLAHLGRLAQSQARARIELPLAETARNRPIRDFLQMNVGAYKRPGLPVSYLVPARIAASVRHAPPPGERLPAAQDVDREQDEGVTAELEVRRRAEDTSRRLAWIAADLSEPAQILASYTAWQRTLAPKLDREYVAPRSEVERRLAEIWAEVLGLERVGVRDVFFELDGDSLGMVQIVVRTLDVLGVELPITAFFENPTIEAHARKVIELQTAAP